MWKSAPQSSSVQHPGRASEESSLGVSGSFVSGDLHLLTGTFWICAGWTARLSSPPARHTNSLHLLLVFIGLGIGGGGAGAILNRCLHANHMFTAHVCTASRDGVRHPVLRRLVLTFCSSTVDGVSSCRGNPSSGGGEGGGGSWGPINNHSNHFLLHPPSFRALSREHLHFCHHFRRFQRSKPGGGARFWVPPTVARND